MEPKTDIYWKTIYQKYQKNIREQWDPEIKEEYIDECKKDVIYGASLCNNRKIPITPIEHYMIGIVKKELCNDKSPN